MEYTHTLLVLPLELLAEVGDETVVKVLDAKMGVARSCLDLEDILCDVPPNFRL